ncbi:MAG: hypothetical protein V2J13_10680 [Cycloclasticus sp.]|jgi:hypothetical protein|nr:hypothetical protein [Cycloclasticus sp.]
MKKYSLYSQNVESTEREVMRELYPSSAEYLPFYLFPQTHEQAFGVPASQIVDLSIYNFVDSAEDKLEPTDVTRAEFDAQADALLGSQHTGREIILSTTQGRYLRDTRYPPIEQEI